MIVALVMRTNGANHQLDLSGARNRAQCRHEVCIAVPREDVEALRKRIAKKRLSARAPMIDSVTAPTRRSPLKEIALSSASATRHPSTALTNAGLQSEPSPLDPSPRLETRPRS